MSIKLNIRHITDNRLINTVLYGRVEGNQDRGGPPKRLIDSITDWTALLNSGRHKDWHKTDINKENL